MKTQNIVITVVVILVVLVFGFFMFRGADTTVDSDEAGGEDLDDVTAEVKVINIEAKRFEYIPSTVTVKKGDRVKFVITNTDTTHGITIPNLSVGGIDSFEFTANETGSFPFRCPTMCGQGHRNMTGMLIVEE